MRNISYGELANCQNYAEKVVNFYKVCNNGKMPMGIYEAELAVKEYNKEIRSFKAMYGYSIRGYVNTIVDCIGMIVEA
ncbi:MAG: hypothetical protein J6R59_10605 [Paludibacteraceae bacterium]|nr:hypothetical protein [Paludibacteraceae bacterium]